MTFLWSIRERSYNQRDVTPAWDFKVLLIFVMPTRKQFVDAWLQIDFHTRLLYHTVRQRRTLNGKWDKHHTSHLTTTTTSIDLSTNTIKLLYMVRGVLKPTYVTQQYGVYDTLIWHSFEFVTVMHSETVN